MRHASAPLRRQSFVITNAAASIADVDPAPARQREHAHACNAALIAGACLEAGGDVSVGSAHWNTNPCSSPPLTASWHAPTSRPSVWTSPSSTVRARRLCCAAFLDVSASELGGSGVHTSGVGGETGGATTRSRRRPTASSTMGSPSPDDEGAPSVSPPSPPL